MTTIETALITGANGGLVVFRNCEKSTVAVRHSAWFGPRFCAVTCITVWSPGKRLSTRLITDEMSTSATASKMISIDVYVTGSSPLENVTVPEPVAIEPIEVPDFYPVDELSIDVAAVEKLALLRAADQAARAADPRKPCARLGAGRETGDRRARSVPGPRGCPGLGCRLHLSRSRCV